ncbi:MAG: hypothetical protein FWD38_06440 [Oscillospiraceae bacterium]|nr:hypothetical protein [Oscillospiraceae bacterium]
MLALAIIITVLVLISFLRFGVIVEYSKDGLRLWAKAGFLRFELLRKDKKKKQKKEKKKDRKVNIKPGSFKDFKDMIKALFEMMGRLKRRLLIKELTLYYVSGGDNPVSTAIKYGASNAVIAVLVTQIKKRFRVKKIDLKSWFDFSSPEQGIYAKVILSIAVWEVFYILFALKPVFAGMFRNAAKQGDKKRKNNSDINDAKDNSKDNTDRNRRKDGKDNGKTPDKRFNGNDNAKSERDD